MFINVMGKRWKIKIVDKVDSEDSWGQAIYENSEILLLKSLTDEFKKRILLHEIVHIILYQTGLGNLLTSELEEAIADSFDCNLYQFFDVKNIKFCSNDRTNNEKRSIPEIKEL